MSPWILALVGLFPRVRCPTSADGFSLDCFLRVSLGIDFVMAILMILHSFYRWSMTPQVHRSYLGPFLPIPIRTSVPFVPLFFHWVFIFLVVNAFYSPKVFYVHRIHLIYRDCKNWLSVPQLCYRFWVRSVSFMYAWPPPPTPHLLPPELVDLFWIRSISFMYAWPPPPTPHLLPPELVDFCCKVSFFSFTTWIVL
jgi:hypothetical protein